MVELYFILMSMLRKRDDDIRIIQHQEPPGNVYKGMKHSQRLGTISSWEPNNFSAIFSKTPVVGITDKFENWLGRWTVL